MSTKWGYGPNGERERFDEAADLPKGWAATPAAHWSKEERAAPEWPAWYVEAMRVYDEGKAASAHIGKTGVPSIPREAEPAAPKRRGRPPGKKAAEQ